MHHIGRAARNDHGRTGQLLSVRDTAGKCADRNDGDENKPQHMASRGADRRACQAGPARSGRSEHDYGVPRGAEILVTTRQQFVDIVLTHGIGRKLRTVFQ